ncbi:MAG: helix-turn-helix transcriptional regulator [Deltaproteobacteria bacterium]|nr:helix-turn-helix transcriptional regulator [Deltaproteobacteria bacterium]
MPADENRLKIIRDDLGGISQAKLADLVGLPVYKIKYAETPGVKISHEIAQVVDEKLGYRLHWVLLGEGPKKKDEVPAPQPVTQPGFPAHEFVLIRQVSGRISAGNGLLPDDSIDMLAAFRRKWIKKKGGNPERMSLIAVEGDSMEPTFLSGDLVLVDHGRNTIPARGGIYAIAIDDEIMIKRVQPVSPEKLLVISDNKQYPPFEIGRNQVQINGKVIWFARELEK